MTEPIDLDAVQALYDADMEVDEYVPDLIAELRRIRRGAKTLGETLHHTNMEVLDAVGAHQYIGADGDGDWAGVYELLAELRPDRDQWKARAEKAEATIARVRKTIDDEHYASTEGNLIVAMHNLREALEGKGD